MADDKTPTDDQEKLAKEVLAGERQITASEAVQRMSEEQRQEMVRANRTMLPAREPEPTAQQENVSLETTAVQRKAASVSLTREMVEKNGASMDGSVTSGQFVPPSPDTFKQPTTVSSQQPDASQTVEQIGHSSRFIDWKDEAGFEAKKDRIRAEIESRDAKQPKRDFDEPDK